jgi:hypothetical protein
MARAACDSLAVMRWLAVFVLSLAFLGWGIARLPVTAAFTDPVGHVRAQDEALYANGALDFAARGGWATPRFLGRFLLYKPPLAAWLGGVSIRIFGVSLWALRLPFLLAAATAALLVFAWILPARGAPLAWGGWLLLLGSASWQVFACLAYTDILVAFFATAALFLWQRDPDGRKAWSAPLIGGAIAAAILAKSVAGLIPWLAIGVAVALRRGGWPGFLRLTAWAALFAAPWHLYQLAAHREWFWTEYVVRQIFAFGTQSVAMQAQEDPHWLFYGRRALELDPLLWAGGLAGAAALWRKRADPACLAVIAWLLTGVAALFAFRYRNLQYVVPLLPALAVAAALALPARFRHALWIVALPVALLHVPRAQPEPPAFANLRDYAGLARGNPLVLVDTDDEFYASLQPLPRVHYFFVDPGGLVLNYAPQYRALGITLPAAEFQDLGRYWEGYRGALRSAGLDSTEPIGTAVVAPDESEILRTVERRPDCDYYLPERYAKVTPPSTHECREAAGGRVFWLSRQGVPRPQTWLRIPAGTRW